MQSTYSAPSAFNGSSARRRGNRVAAAVRRRMRKNKPVRRALAKPGKTIAKRNRGAIYTLARQVKSLQMSQYGLKKMQTQSCVLLNSVPTMAPSSVKPLIMCVSDLYDGNKFFQGSVNAAGEPLITQSQQMLKQTFDLDIKNQYQWNERMNATTEVSREAYLPISTKLKFTMQGQLPAGYNRPLRYRFTLLKTKRSLLTSNVSNHALPNYVGAYWHMCEDNANIRNTFSKRFHTVLQDKWLTILPAKVQTSNIPVYRTVELPYVFGRSTPYVVDLNRTSAALPIQTVYTNLPEDEVIWCLVSSNATGPTGLDIVFSRDNVWRDNDVIS